MGKNITKKYWSPVWGKVVNGVCFTARSEMGGGMVVTSDERVISIIEGSKAFRAKRVKLISDERLGISDEAMKVEGGELKVEGVAMTGDCGCDSLRSYEEVVSFQAARDVVVKAMKEAGEEVKIMKSKAEVKREAERLGIRFPNLK